MTLPRAALPAILPSLRSASVGQHCSHARLSLRMGFCPMILRCELALNSNGRKLKNHTARAGSRGHARGVSCRLGAEFPALNKSSGDGVT